MTVVASNYARKENDLYQTEPWATQALLKHLPSVQGGCVWEPAAGNHLMADVLREHGAEVWTSDIQVYDRPHNFFRNFLTGAGNPIGLPRFDAIITNPPYGKGNRDAVRFAELALKQCDGWVALLLTAKFDFGKTRTHLFRDNFRYHLKIALIDRIQWFPGNTTGTEDHAWYVWRPESEQLRPPYMAYEGRSQ